MTGPTRVAILGAGGRISREVVRMLAGREDVRMTRVLRDPCRFSDPLPVNSLQIEADVLDDGWLWTALAGQHVVVAALSGKVDQQAQAIIEAMRGEAVRRIIFVAAFGIYGEADEGLRAPLVQATGPWLAACRRAADRIEAAGLDHTILRPAWLTDADEIDYDTTERHEPFRGHDVSRRSVAALIVAAIDAPQTWSRRNVGVGKPVSGDRPVVQNLSQSASFQPGRT